MTSSTVRVSTEKVRLKQSDPRWVEFQHWHLSYQGTVSIHKYGTVVDIECIRWIYLTAVPRTMNDPGTEADHPLFYLKKVAASLSINLARVPHTFWTLPNERDLGVTIDDELKIDCGLWFSTLQQKRSVNILGTWDRESNKVTSYFFTFSC